MVIVAAIALTGARRLRKRYGDTFTLRVERYAPWVVISHPDDVKTVFTGDPNVLHACRQGIP